MVAKELHVGDSGGVFHVYECGARTTFERRRRRIFGRTADDDEEIKLIQYSLFLLQRGFIITHHQMLPSAESSSSDSLPSLAVNRASASSLNSSIA